MAFRVEADDLELERLTLVNDVARMRDALVAQFADVDQAFQPVANAYECAEVHELGDRPVDHVADVEISDRRVPRIRLQSSNGQADSTALVVDVDDLGLNLLANLVAGLGVVDLVPRQLALVHEAVDPTEVDEDPERGDAAHRAGDLLADLEAAEELIPLLAALLVQRHLLRQDQTVGLAIDLEDLEPEPAADERHQLLGDLLRRVARLIVLRTAREIDDLADRNETADPAVDDQATLVVVDDRSLDDDALFELLLHRAPFALEAGPPEREDDVPFGRFGLEDVHQDRVADREGRLGFPTPAKELSIADDPFALGTDVDQDLVLVDANDRAVDDVTVLEALDVGVLLGEQLLHRGGLGSREAGRQRINLSRGSMGKLVVLDDRRSSLRFQGIRLLGGCLRLRRCLRLGHRFRLRRCLRLGHRFRLRLRGFHDKGFGGIVRGDWRRGGLLGGRGRGNRLGRRRRPALLFFGQFDDLLQSSVPPGIKNGSSSAQAVRLAIKWSVDDLPRSAPSTSKSG